MKKRILVMLMLAAAVVSTFPTGVFAAAKKTVYVIESITAKSPSGRTEDKITYTYNKNGLVTKRVWRQPGAAASPVLPGSDLRTVSILIHTDPY